LWRGAHAAGAVHNWRRPGKNRQLAIEDREYDRFIEKDDTRAPSPQE
jgi:hypothetical protein